MLPFNTFSIHDLLGFVVMAPLAVLFYIMYWKLDRRLVDLLFALWLTFLGGYSLVAFLMDNLIPEGQSSYAFPGANVKMLMLCRITYVMGLFALASQLHFVLRYCRINNVISRNIKWAYVVCAVVIPFVWTPWWLKLLTVPHGDVASWQVAVPWLPDAGPLQLVFTAAWAAVMAYCIVQLFRLRKIDDKGGAPGQYKLVRLAFLFQAITTTAEVVNAMLGLATISVLPTSSMVVAILLATALVRERMAEGRLKEQLTHEMDLAARIQHGLLPADHPPVCGYELAGWSRPAQHAGGDTYDFFGLPDGRWMITIADATGHGLGAAMMISGTRAIFRTVARRTPDAAVILAETHQQLSHDLPDGNFVTGFVGILDPLNGTLSYASAGHGPIIFYDCHGNSWELQNATVLPLGLRPDIDFSNSVRHRRMRSGDLLILVSDGLYEALNDHREQFGTERLMASITPARHTSVAGIIEQARSAVDVFQGGGVQLDDMTMVILRRREVTATPS